MDFAIQNRMVGDKHPVFIIAEASSNHGGAIERAKKMIDIAAAAGADAVKFQVFTAETLVADYNHPALMLRPGATEAFVEKDTKLVDLFKENELPYAWLPQLVEHARKCGIIFLATPFDEEAVDVLESVGVPAYKIASNEFNDVPLLQKVAQTKKPLILSTGMTDIAGIKETLSVIEEVATDPQIALLHCNSTYPSPDDEIHLRALRTMEQEFPRCVLGYSDHSLGIGVPIAAAVLGAAIIEKHFMLDDDVVTVDRNFSLLPQELATMVTSIRQAQRALGSYEKLPTQQGKRRSLWIVKDVKKGERFTEANIKSLRPGLGISSIHYRTIIGKRAAGDLKAVKPLVQDDVGT